MIVYLNGNFVPAGEAQISVFDRGFLFGDGVYEVIRYFDGHPIGLDRHINRLARSLRSIQMDDEIAYTLPQSAAALLSHNEIVDGAVYLQITRGAGETRAHLPDSELKPTVLGLAWELPSFAECESVGLRSIHAVLQEDIRWGRCDIKSLNLLPNVLARMFADETDAEEAILHHDGFITEGITSTVLVVHDGEVYTSPTTTGDQATVGGWGGSQSILDGVTRRVLQDAGVVVNERRISIEELQAADEILITSSSRLLRSVVVLDGEPVGIGESCGQVGAVGCQIYAALLESLRVT